MADRTKQQPPSDPTQKTVCTNASDDIEMRRFNAKRAPANQAKELMESANELATLVNGAYDCGIPLTPPIKNKPGGPKR